MQQPSGRERRRKGLVNRARRVLYGVALWLGAHAADAAQDPGGRLHAMQAPAVAASSVAVVQIRAPGGLAGIVHPDLRIPVAALPEAGQPLIAENDTARLIALSVDSTVLGALRDGMAVKLSMGDLGGLRLNLYKRRNAKSGGQAYELNPDGADAAPAHQFWSLGGSLDLVRDTSGRREVVFTPQLLLDFDSLTGSDNHFQAFLQYASWKPGMAGNRTSDEKVPQVAIKLRF